MSSIQECLELSEYIYFWKALCASWGYFSCPVRTLWVFLGAKAGGYFLPVRVAKNSAEPVLCSSSACAFPWKTSLPQQKDLHTETAEFQLKTHWRDLTENPTNKQKKPKSFNGNQSIPTVIRANDTPLKSYLWFSPLILFLACLWVTPGSYLYWRNY